MDVYAEVPSAATRKVLEKLGQWLDSDCTAAITAAVLLPPPTVR